MKKSASIASAVAIVWSSSIGWPVGCSSSDEPEGGGASDAAAGGSDADASSSPGSADGALVDSGGDGSDASTCDDCGSPRFNGACMAEEMACLGDPGCAAIRSCIFSGDDASTPCTLGPSGPACVERCIRARCTGAASAALYRALDHCAYCGVCLTACGPYCGGFTDAGTSCP
ncbi:MAG TPA: hypothetical protein VJT73_15060 [Polyangiaceae bacterium]|nr:hypothetical protein [Polyangiaceae bacterium]